MPIGVQLRLYDGAGSPVVNQTEIQAIWWDSTDPNDGTAPVGGTYSAETDTNGDLVLDLSAVSSLLVGDYGFLMLYQPDSADYHDALTFSGRVQTSDITSGAIMYAPFYETLLPAYTTDSSGLISTKFADARTADLYVPDHGGVLHAIPGGTVAFEGARVVRNVVNDLANVAAAPVTYSSVGGASYVTKVDANTVQFTAPMSNTWGKYGSIFWNIDSAHKYARRRVICRVKLTGNGSVLVKTSANGATNKVTESVTLTSYPVVITVRCDQTIDTPAWGPTFYIERRVGYTATEVTVHDVQIEDVDTNTTVPGEYTPDIAFYSTQNGNTVDANGVVTEAVGAAITTPVKMVHAPAATNYADGANDLSGGPETITLSSTGDYTLSVYGTAAVTVAAGTATGTGFGQATENNPVTFNLTATGTVTLTLASGALDVVYGAAAKQVEDGMFSTPFIPTSGATASRDIFQIRAPYTGNFNQSEGMAYMEWEPGFAAAADSALLALTTAAGLMTATSTGIKSNDGTTNAIATYAFAADTRYHVAVRWKTGSTFQVGYREHGSASWTWGAAQTYDGDFATDSLFTRLFYNSPYMNNAHNLEILNTDIGTAGIESRYSLARVG